MLELLIFGGVPLGVVLNIQKEADHAVEEAISKLRHVGWGQLDQAVEEAISKLQACGEAMDGGRLDQAAGEPISTPGACGAASEGS